MNIEWSGFSSAIIGAIVGGLIAGLFSLATMKRSFANQDIQAKGEEEKIIMSLMQAIHDEIETIYERYQDTIGSRLDTLGNGEALALYYPLVSDFFTVYNGNSFLIGRIPDNDLRKQVIKTYTLAKGMVDSFRLNNELVRKFEYSHSIFLETQQEIHKQQAAAHYSALVKYAIVLKEGHQALKQDVLHLLRMLRKHGVLSESGS